jgi:hypothetical protein
VGAPAGRAQHRPHRRLPVAAGPDRRGGFGGERWPCSSPTAGPVPAVRGRRACGRPPGNRRTTATGGGSAAARRRAAHAGRARPPTALPTCRSACRSGAASRSKARSADSGSRGPAARSGVRPSSSSGHRRAGGPPLLARGRARSAAGRAGTSRRSRGLPSRPAGPATARRAASRSRRSPRRRSRAPRPPCQRQRRVRWGGSRRTPAPRRERSGRGSWGTPERSCGEGARVELERPGLGVKRRPELGRTTGPEAPGACRRQRPLAAAGAAVTRRASTGTRPASAC